MAAGETLSAADISRVSAAVAHIETLTSGEIVCMVAPRALDPEPYAWAFSGMLALATPWALLWLTAWPLLDILLAQLGVLALGMAIVRVLGLRVIPGTLVKRRVREEAEARFAQHGLANTSGRTGLLLFVALAEHRVEVVVDMALADQALQPVWDTIVATVVAAIREERLADGLIAAVDQAAEALARIAPPRPDDRNELPNVIA